MASIITNAGIALLNEDYWEGAADIEVMLLASTYTPNKDHDTVSDIVASEIAATSYSRIALAGRTGTVDNANDRVDYDADDTDFGAIGGAANATIGFAAIIENDGVGDSTSPVIAIIELADTVTTDGSTFKQVWADPIFRVSQA